MSILYFLPLACGLITLWLGAKNNPFNRKPPLVAILLLFVVAGFSQDVPVDTITVQGYTFPVPCVDERVMYITNGHSFIAVGYVIHGDNVSVDVKHNLGVDQFTIYGLRRVLDEYDVNIHARLIHGIRVWSLTMNKHKLFERLHMFNDELLQKT